MVEELGEQTYSIVLQYSSSTFFRDSFFYYADEFKGLF